MHQCNIADSVQTEYCSTFHCSCVRVFVCSCVTGVTSHISHIYKGINAMLIIRDPSIPIYSEYWVNLTEASINSLMWSYWELLEMSSWGICIQSIQGLKWVHPGFKYLFPFFWTLLHTRLMQFFFGFRPQSSACAFGWAKLGFMIVFKFIDP